MPKESIKSQIKAAKSLTVTKYICAQKFSLFGEAGQSKMRQKKLGKEFTREYKAISVFEENC